jgi:hypothetical protein
MNGVTLKPGECLIEIISGVEGPSVYIGDNSSGHRLSGPKPWGGGKTLHRFKVNIDELMREAAALKEQPQ